MKVVKRPDGNNTIRTDNGMLYENSAYNWTKDGYEILLEEDEEIDIDSIEKLNDILRVEDLEYPHGKNDSIIWKQVIKQQNKINELVKAVKQLNKKIKE